MSAPLPRRRCAAGALILLAALWIAAPAPAHARCEVPPPAGAGRAAAAAIETPRAAGNVRDDRIAADPLIQAMLDEATISAVWRVAAQLSGALPVVVGGQTYTITTRHTASGAPLAQATQFVGEQLARLGYTVEYQTWSKADHHNRNVIGQRTGLTRPEEVFIIGAHLDDMPRESPAPGADDNASGSAAVLLAADIMSRYRWACTLRFAFWTGEEQGFLGSSAYVVRASANGEAIQGYLNLDMIGYNSAPPRAMDLFWSSAVTGSEQIADRFAAVVAAYNLDLMPQKRDVRDFPLGAYSDNWSFWAQGYPAILVIEDSYGDFSPYYHRATDRIETLDMDYFRTMVQASVGTFAHMTGCLLGRDVRRAWLPMVSIAGRR